MICCKIGASFGAVLFEEAQVGGVSAADLSPNGAMIGFIQINSIDNRNSSSAGMVQGNEWRVGTKQSEESMGVERVAQVVAAGWTLAFLGKAPIQVHRGERATAAMEMSS